MAAVRCLVPAGAGAATLQRWVRHARQRLPARPGVVSVVTVSPRMMARLNGAWRGKPQPTNVLSFQLSPGTSRSTPETVWGEIVLCPAVIRREAVAQRRAYRSYLRFLLEHGLIHLFGLDHHTKRQRRAWARYEQRLKL